MKTDIYRSYYGHPILSAGYNSWDNNGDEVDGAGVNEPVWPVYFDTFEPLLVLIITPAMAGAGLCAGTRVVPKILAG